MSLLAAANEEFSRTEALFQEYELYAEKQMQDHELELSGLRQYVPLNTNRIATTMLALNQI